MRQKLTYRGYTSLRRRYLDGDLGTDGGRAGSLASSVWGKKECNSWQERREEDGGACRWWVEVSLDFRGCWLSWRLSYDPVDLYNSIYKSWLQRWDSTCAWPSRSIRRWVALVPMVSIFQPRGIGQQSRQIHRHPWTYQQKFPLHPH